MSFALFAVVVVLTGLQPLATIWAVNTLFPRVAIPFTVETWCAMLWLTAIVGGVAFGPAGWLLGG